MDRQSYGLHEAQCRELLQALHLKLNSLSKKQGRLAAVTEDWASENAIRSLLAQRIKRIDETSAKLNEDFRRVMYYASNPDKIPDNLKTENPRETTSKENNEGN